MVHRIVRWQFEGRRQVHALLGDLSKTVCGLVADTGRDVSRREPVTCGSCRNALARIDAEIQAATMAVAEA